MIPFYTKETKAETKESESIWGGGFAPFFGYQNPRCFRGEVVLFSSVTFCGTYGLMG